MYSVSGMSSSVKVPRDRSTHNTFPVYGFNENSLNVAVSMVLNFLGHTQDDVKVLSNFVQFINLSRR